MPLTKVPDRGVVLARHGSPARSTRNSGLFDESDDDETQMSEDLMSLTGSDPAESIGGDSGDGGRGWTVSAAPDRMRSLNELAQKNMNPDETILFVQQFEKSADIPFRRTYELGKYVRNSLGSTHSPNIGLVFLPGGDLPEVNRLEQQGMVSLAPDQRSALWRVNTAGSLLQTISVTGDLNLITEDVTKDVAAITQLRVERERERTSSYSKSYNTFNRAAVTIESENVEIVHEFDRAKRELDMAATLIEVYTNALWVLMTDYKQIIRQGGPLMKPDQTKELLDQMIEAARRFCLLSPILFRMSTRPKIIVSNNTRYGVDSEYGFKTWTTSAGIKEIIMMSASYYSALDPSAPGMDDFTQKIIRPKFLQMLTLLLSLLNDHDLRAMAEFIHKTFGIVARRPDMELLFLKVIPLTSINSRVFLQGLVPAVDQWALNNEHLKDEPRVWKNFIKNLARKGYLLPGSVEDLGHRENSWIFGWPEAGIHSSTIFSRLQYHGEKSSTFNQIPTARFSFEPDLTELTVLMTNDETYSIHPEDYEQISRLSKGLYNITRCNDGTISDLEVTEIVINQAINEAIQVINNAIRIFNSSLGSTSKRKSRGWLTAGKPRGPAVFPDLNAAHRVSKCKAAVDGTVLAVAYKINGKPVPKREATHYMGVYYNQVKSSFERICEKTGSHSHTYYHTHIEQVKRFLHIDREARRFENSQPLLSDAPIARAFGPDDADTSSAKIWYDYTVSVQPDPHYPRELLHIRAKVDYVLSVTWRKPGEQAEVVLVDTPTRFFVAPLKPVSEAQQEDEICVQDLVLLVGRYLVIATLQQNDFNNPCVMTNWLEIQEAHTEEGRRRGRNFAAKSEHPVMRFV